MKKPKRYTSYRLVDEHAFGIHWVLCRCVSEATLAVALLVYSVLRLATLHLFHPLQTFDTFAMVVNHTFKFRCQELSRIRARRTKPEKPGS